MIEFALRIQQFLLLFVQTKISAARILLLSKKTKRTEKAGTGKDIVILANGPSLALMIDENRSFLDRKALMAVNYFPTTELYTQLKPAYFIVIAPEMWLDGVDHELVVMRETLFRALAEKTDWPLTLFISSAAKKMGNWHATIKPNKNIRTEYINTTPIEGFKWFRYCSFDRGWGMPRPHNILIPSLMQSVRLGFERIYIYGADHNWMKDLTVSDDNLVLLNQKHFYDKDTSTSKPMHKKGTGTRKLHEVLDKFMLSFRAYHEIDAYAKARGCTIVNCTPGSFIDAFERKR